MSRTYASKNPQGSVVATDASVLFESGKHVGVAYLDDCGDWWVLGYQNPADRDSASLVLHAELRAIAAAIRRHRHPVTVLSDSKSAIDLIDAWKVGEMRTIPNYHGKKLNQFARSVARDPALVQVDWVKGHADHSLNRGAHSLAGLAARGSLSGHTGRWITGNAAQIAKWNTNQWRRAA